MVEVTSDTQDTALDQSAPWAAASTKRDCKGSTERESSEVAVDPEVSSGDGTFCENSRYPLSEVREQEEAKQQQTSSSPSSTGLKIQSSTVRLLPTPSWRAASSTEALRAFESRLVRADADMLAREKQERKNGVGPDE